MCLLDIHGDLFIGFLLYTVNFANNDLRPGNTEFIAFAAHVLDENGQMQLTAPGHPELVRVTCILYAQGYVMYQFTIESFLYVP
jgi:hypothetical protein